jgi:hypothetical protein
MPASSPASQPSLTPASTLSPGVQTLASFLIFLQLFALAVGVTANESPSQLETALRARTGLRAYLELLAMDLSYAFTLSYGPTTIPGGDSEAWIDVELDMPDGSKLTERLPPTGLWSRQRMRHYDLLARRSVSYLGNPTLEGLVASDIAARLVKETGATAGKIYLRWRQLPTVPFTTTGDQTLTAYEARILASDGNVELLKIESASESAPASETKDTATKATETKAAEAKGSAK